jgi:hypothetical protein
MATRFWLLAAVLLAFSATAAARPTRPAKEAGVRHYSIVITGSTHTERIDSGNGPQNDGQLVEDLTWSARFKRVSVQATSSSFGDAVSLSGPAATFTSHFSFQDSYQVEGGPCSGTVNDQLPGTVALVGSAFAKTPRARFFHFSAQLDGSDGIGPDVDAATRNNCHGNILSDPSWVGGDRHLVGGVVARRPTPYLLSVLFDGHKTKHVRDIIRSLARGHAVLLNSGTVARKVSRSCQATCTNSSNARIKMQFIPR